MPRLAPSAAKSADTSGRIVLQSMYNRPCLALAKMPSSPRATLWTSGESESMGDDDVGTGDRFRGTRRAPAARGDEPLDRLRMPVIADD
jgi:hypothetical protein